MPPVPDDLFDSLAERLRDAHAAVRRLDAPADRKAALTKRLIAITDASKHDLGRAAERLDALLDELESPCDTAGPVFEGGEPAP